MENNKIKDMLNQVNPSDDLKDKLLNIKYSNVYSMPKQKRFRGRLVGAAAAVGIFLLVGTGTVYAANKLGLNLFVKNLPDDATQYINTEVVTELKENNIDKLNGIPVSSDGEQEKINSIVNISPVETICDGESCLIALEARLIPGSEYIMLPREYSVSEKCIFEDAYENESFGKYAKRVGKKILKVSVDLDVKYSLDNNYSGSIDSKLIDADNSIMYVSISSSLGDADRLQEGTKLDLHYYVDVCESPEDENNWSVAKDEIVSVVVENVANSRDEYFYRLSDNKEMVVEDSGITINSIKLINTELETKAEFEVTNADKEIGNWVSINLVDDNDDFFELGVSDGGIATEPDENGKFIVSDIAYKKMDLPDHVNIRVKNLNTGEEYYLRNIPCVK